jgi:Spy/CpxP family protein refolding chaperone
MSNRLHQLILAVAISGLAGGVLAQNAPDTDPAMHSHAMHNKDGGEDENRHDGDDYHYHHHHHWQHHRHWHHHHWGRGDQQQGLMRAFHNLNLSAAQQQQIHGIVSNARQQFATQRTSGAADRMALMNPGDPNYAAAVQAAKKRAADRIQRVSDLKQQLYNVLTPDQKSQLSKSMAEWKAKGQPAPANR